MLNFYSKIKRIFFVLKTKFYKDLLEKPSVNNKFILQIFE